MKQPAGKNLAIVGYASALLLFVHLIVFIAVLGIPILLNWKKGQPFATFHLRQMAGIAILSILISALAYSIENTLIVLCLIGFMVLIALLGLVSALRNQTVPLPFVGAFFQKYLTFIQ